MDNTDNTDWKTLAIELGQRVAFALERMKLDGGGDFLLNLETGEATHAHDYLVEPLRKLPGFKIDEERFMYMRLPKAQRRKKLKDLHFKRNPDSRVYVD